jgi:hypothetical protein
MPMGTPQEEPHLLFQIPLLRFAEEQRPQSLACPCEEPHQFHPKKKTVRGSPEASREVAFNRLR